MYVFSYTGSLFRILPSSLASTPTISDVSSTTEDQQEESPSEGDNDQVSSQTGNSNPAVILGLYGDSSYSPNPITIERGQTITWYNGDTISHTVTSGRDTDEDEDAGQGFDSEAVIPNHYYSITFDDSGEYPYYCFYHPSMVGEVIVE